MIGVPTLFRAFDTIVVYKPSLPKSLAPPPPCPYLSPLPPPTFIFPSTRYHVGGIN